MKEIAVHVDNVTKSFRLPHERYDSLKQSTIHMLNRKTYSEFSAVSKVNFEIHKGEFFGIVGKNGSGKSTLLKMLAGIYVPSSGKIKLSGRLSPFIELGVGFNPELTARENVFLNGAILGLNRSQINEKFDEIIRFAELEEFVDQKLKNFSSGMQVRLAFSISVQVQADILLVDEVLAVGDASFQEKCFDVFRSLKRAGKTIVFVTHDMATVREFCDRVLIMNNGRQVGVTSPDEASNIYAQLNAEASAEFLTKTEEPTDTFGTGDIKITDVIFDSNGTATRVFSTGQPFDITIKYDNKIKAKEATFGIGFHSSEGHTISGPNNSAQKKSVLTGSITYRAICRLLPGNYKISVGIFDPTNGVAFDYHDKTYNFVVKDNDLTTEGFIDLGGEWLAH